MVWSVLLGVGGVIYTPYTLKPLKELGLDTHTATKLALKLHAHSVQYAYKLASVRSSFWCEESISLKITQFCAVGGQI
eukprot:1152529-Pelagomonas_calceolata.AAC.3